MMGEKVLRVFVRRTGQTPDDEYVRIGLPDMFMPKDIKQIHISVVFTWDREAALRLKENYCKYAPTYVGGPAFPTKSLQLPDTEPSNEFRPGFYVKKGITYTSRGCNFRCSFCLVPTIEGRFREIEIKAGNVIQDNNILLSSRSHFRKVCQMLRTQRAIRFLGGLDNYLLKGWHIEELRSLRIKELWFALDSWGGSVRFKRAMGQLGKAGFTRHQLRCYVLAGYREPIQASEDRLRFAYECGALPYIQVYQPPAQEKRMAGEKSRKDNLFVREWSRPGIIKARMEESAVGCTLK